MTTAEIDIVIKIVELKLQAKNACGYAGQYEVDILAALRALQQKQNPLGVGDSRDNLISWLRRYGGPIQAERYGAGSNLMIVTITNSIASEIQILGLPGGGKIGASSNAAFTISERDFEGLWKKLYSLVDHGIITIAIDPESYNDFGARVYRRRLTIGHADLDAAALTQTITDTVTLPSNAFCVGVAINVGTLFSGGAVTSCAADIGHNDDIDFAAASMDVFTGADTGYRLPLASAAQPIGGQVFQAKFTTIGANLSALTAGALTLDFLYVLL